MIRLEKDRVSIENMEFFTKGAEAAIAVENLGGMSYKWRMVNCVVNKLNDNQDVVVVGDVSFFKRLKFLLTNNKKILDSRPDYKISVKDGDDK